MSKLRLYVNAFRNVLEERIHDEENNDLIKQYVLYGVKLINLLSDPTDHDAAVNNFQLASLIQGAMSELTPVEFMNVFSIDKEYDGEKYGTKDYFYTIDYINSLDHEKPIGEEIEMFLWNYRNRETSQFTMSIMGLISDIRKFEGKPSIAEEWASENGLEMHTLHTDAQGKEYLLDRQGRTQKLNKPKPRRPKYLKLVK